MFSLSRLVFVGGTLYDFSLYPEDYVAGLRREYDLASDNDVINFLENEEITPEYAEEYWPFVVTDNGPPNTQKE